MPWKEVKPMDEKLLFMADYLRGTDKFSHLCDRYGISRKTGYKWVARYTDTGVDGLEERSSRRKTQSTQTPYSVEQAILKLREHSDAPGASKIQAMLARKMKEEEIPSLTTIHNILRKAGKVVTPRKPRGKSPALPGPLRSAAQPNELWSADYKGQFKTSDGKWCYPLTIMDHASRYLLGCQCLAGTTHDETRHAFERVFREYGLPERIRTDNGTPFSSIAVGGLSRLSVWWIRLNIRPERIEAGQPQQNGRHERMHRTLKRSLGLPTAANLQQQQSQLDGFKTYYNEQRPHAALGQIYPKECYQASPREYPNRLPELAYPSYVEPRQVHGSGVVYWRNLAVYIGNVLTGEVVGIDAVADGIWGVYFGPFFLGCFDERNTTENNYVKLNV
jgi:transposase InsO family protein